MKLYRKADSAFIFHDESWYLKQDIDWDKLLNREGLYNELANDIKNWTHLENNPPLPMDAPIKSQEVWAAGVTYLRSKVARMEEAEAAGGGDFYDRVYDAERPEIFFKATAARTVGDGETVYIRSDSSWNVPEPELTLFCCSAGTIEGYTIGNDMSSRSIEGENPLYLPQAKTYDRSAALGPCIYVPQNPISPDTKIRMSIQRGDMIMYEDSVAISQMKRSLKELAHYLYRACSYPHGCFLMTGTCLVPDDNFTLHVSDKIEIEIDKIGTLQNYVEVRPSF